MARPSTAKLAIDMNMTFLLTAQPALPVSVNIDQALSQALAIITGVLAATLTYHLVIPSSPVKHRMALARRIARQTRSLVRVATGKRSERAHARINALLLPLVMLEGHTSPLIFAAMRCAVWVANMSRIETQTGVTLADLQREALMATEALQSVVQELSQPDIPTRRKS
ncbi:FUSC family protein, partial [Pseudomonas sp.]|uniref:FUSC family protein n=1 Tax=Pseudomonas sp. TaxID=306 RepID=UPI00260D4CF4